MIYRAVTYSLFASGNNPKRSLLLRAAVFGVILAVAGLLAYRVAPHSWPLAGGSLQLSALVFLLTSLFDTLLFVLLGGYVAGGLRRILPIVQLLPLRPWQVKLCCFLAYTPVILLASSLTIPGLWHFFADSLSMGKLVYVLLISHTLALVFNVTVRSAATNINPQITSLVGIFIAALAANSLVVNKDAGLALVLAGLLFLVQLIGAISFVHRPTANLLYKKTWPVIQAENIKLASALYIRSLRTGRFTGSLGLVFVTLLGLSLAAVLGKTLPFAAAAAATILLSGTLALEVRALSRERHALELVLYGRFTKWIATNWFLTGCAAACFTVLVLFLAVQWFPGQMGVTNQYFLCLAVCLATCGIAAASIIVPARGDILAQIGSAVLYAALSWATFRLFNTFQNQDIQIMVAEVCLLLAIAHAAEKQRWLTTIRGKYAFRKQQT